MQPEDLCEAIRRKCAARHWYGPDAWWSASVAKDDPRRYGFELPPLTEEQVNEAEATLGFPLPITLRTLYTRLANGGFGPHYGILRLAGEPSETDRTVLEWHQDFTERCTFFDLEDLVQPGKNVPFAVSVWPRFVLPICEEGCGNYFCLHAVTGQILTVEIWDAHESGLAYVADSLDQWLQTWVESPLRFFQ
ncbi:MAG TPA: SMI1/KNR4 family protein [Ktedonobacteraceae bacterium]|jgi:hypothetical protein|nr:SMI1/KNR4 family protein [Ktedonobacteraceae bacterium]